MTRNRAGVLLERLQIGHPAYELFESFCSSRTLVTLNVQMGMPYLFYSPIVNHERRYDIPPPQMLCDATSAWLNSYCGAIDYNEFIIKMFGELLEFI